MPVSSVSDAEDPVVPKKQIRRYKRPLRQQVFLRVGTAFLVGIVLLGVAGGVLAQQVSSAQDNLQEALELIPELRDELSAGEPEEAKKTFARVLEHVASARSTTTGPLWQAATMIPFAGPNFSAVTAVAVSADDIMSLAIGPLLERYDSLDWESLSPVEGRVELDPLQEVAPTVTSAAATIRLSSDRLASIDRSVLLPQVAKPVQTVTEQLNAISDAMDTAAAAARLLPSMLGSEEPRNYLVLVQNSAEVRATGGIAGALAIISSDQGEITLGEQSSAGALGTFSPALDIDAQQKALYTARLGRQMQNVNLTPDFPTAATTAKRMWETRHPGETVDGVIALDPVVLSYLLDATGPVNLTDPVVLDHLNGTSLPTSLTHENVVATLLSNVYQEIEDTKAQDAYFAAVASEVFSAFAAGQGGSADILSALGKSVNEERLYVWSARTDEQSDIATTPLAGTIAGPDSDGAAFGIFFNDGTGAKMDYYARRSLALRQTCQDNGYSRYTAQLVLTNVAPPDAAESLPPYVTGNGVFGINPGHIRTNYVFYGPAQSIVETANLNGQAVAFGSGLHGQRPVGTVTVELSPGETAELELTFSRVVQESEPKIRITPSIFPKDDVVLSVSEESACA